MIRAWCCDIEQEEFEQAASRVSSFCTILPWIQLTLFEIFFALNARRSCSVVVRHDDDDDDEKSEWIVNKKKRESDKPSCR